jgi:hypothetical protein
MTLTELSNTSRNVTSAGLDQFEQSVDADLGDVFGTQNPLMLPS